MRIKAAIYNAQSGLIIKRTTGPASMVHLDAAEGEEFYLNCPDDATHILEGEPVTLAEPLHVVLNNIRCTRNMLLAECDYSQLADAMLTPEQHTAYLMYRQALRDLPSVCDPYNPVYPTKP